MKWLFDRLGVDYEQWKAITSALLRSDFRPPGAHTETYSLRTAGGLALMVVTYGLFGLGAAIVVVLNPDVLLTGIAVLSYLAMLVGTALLAQHGSTITSTSDYQILAPLPVSSHTFFAVRVTNVLFHTMLLTTLMGYPPVLAYTLAHAVSVARGLGAAVALYAFSCAITFALVAIYGTLVRVFGAARLSKVVSYTQMFVSILAYGGVVLLLQVVGTRLLATAALPREPWLLLVPPAWFASYIEIASRHTDWNTWLRAAISVACLAALVAVLRGSLGMAYAERLGELTASTSANDPRASARSTWIFRRGERRVVALLVRAHFRHDLRVRLGVLAIVPLTLLYMFMGARDGTGGDPVAGAYDARGVDLVAMAVLFFPTLVVQQFSATDSYRAAWIYFATPADRAALVVALKSVIVSLFFVPYIAFLAALYTWRFGHAGHAVVHASFLGLIGYLALQLGTLVDPRLPFSVPPKKAASSAIIFAWMAIAVIGGNLLLRLLVDFIYGDWRRVAAFGAALLAASALLEIGVRLRSLARYRSFEFS